MARHEKQTKGVRYIAKQLYKYKSNKYATYNDALVKARELNEEFKKSGEKVTIASITKKVTKPRVNKKAPPEPINKWLFDSILYFDLNDKYGKWISQANPQYTFVSKFFNKDLPPLKGGEIPSYPNYFKPYMDYINNYLHELFPEGYESGDIPDYLIICNRPIYNKKEKWWEVEIRAVNKHNQDDLHGFNPNDPKNLPEITPITKGPVQGSQVTEPITKPQEEPLKPSATTEIDKQIELEKQKQITAQIQKERESQRGAQISEAIKAGFTPAQILQLYPPLT